MDPDRNPWVGIAHLPAAAAAPDRRSWLGAAILGAVLALAVGCAPAHGEAWLQAFQAARRAQNAGRYAEAVALYAAAARKAERLKDRDEALFLRARALVRMGDWEQARQAYAALEQLSPAGPRTARAAFEHAHLTIAHGDPAAGWRRLEQAVLRYPNHGSAKLAVSDLVRHIAETEGEEKLRDRLRAWAPRVAGSETEQQLAYEIGRSLERSGQLVEAHAQLLQTARAHPYPKGNLTDDALWEASLVAERLGDAPLAIADLRELLSVREVAEGGSYERPRFPPSQLRIAELYRDRLGDLAAARRELRVMYTEHPTSVLADDAMWQELLLARRLGDGAGACALAAALPQRFPGSRFVRCVQAACPNVAPPPPGRPCPDYIRRQLGP